MLSALAISAAACCPKAFEQTQVKKDISVQLYSLRDQIGDPEKYAANHEEVFNTLAEYGYTSVEAACYDGDKGLFYGVAPEQYKKDVEAAGLVSLSSHVGHWLSDEELASGDFSKSLEWWKKCVEAHKAAGVKYIVYPWMGVPATVKELQIFGDYLNAIGKICKDNDIRFGYHNHSHEFSKVEDKEVMLDYLLTHTDPTLVFFQMDVYWAVWGHVSPVEYFQKYPGRFAMLHIKDKYEIGQSGMVGFDAIFANAETAGLRNLVVEIESFDNTGDWKKSMKMCADYLLKAPFVKASYAGTK